MTEIQYRNRSISELVSELNHLGEPNVLLSPLKLTAVHQKDIPEVKRFKNSHGDQFFIPHNSEKKFAYGEIVQNLTNGQFQGVKELFMRGFNSSVMFAVPRQQGRLIQLLSEIGKIVGNCGCSVACFNEHGIVDAVSTNKLNERDFQGRLKYYKVMQINLIAFLDRLLRGQNKGTISLVKLRSLQQGILSKNEVNLVCLPEQMFSSNLKTNQFLGVCKSQLTQIFNYIKLNPANKYQHFSKVLTKRMPVTNILASLLLQQTATLVVNWMNEGASTIIHQRLVFYDRMREISVLLKKQEGNIPPITQLPNQFKQSRQERPQKSAIRAAKTDRTPVAAFDEESELDYCRSFQRKTHKYSINDIQSYDRQDSPFEDGSREQDRSNTPSPVTHFANEKATSRQREVRRFDETMPRKPPSENFRQSEQIAILKANHAIEVSQYHQTIQQLNKKILVLTGQRNLQELYTIHERQIMLLQLKIKQLRNDISVLCNSTDEKSYKAIVRKLNEEIKRLESKQSEQKVSNGKVMILEKQIAQFRSKYEQSEKARKKLTFELEHLTKRLKICDTQIEILNNKETAMNNFEQKNKTQNGTTTNMLSLNDTESLKEISILIKSIQDGNQQSKGFLLRKITNLMSDLSTCRDSILQCNDFLVQLEEHLQQRLGNKEPQIVLDCNKFIRNFLMENLNVF